MTARRLVLCLLLAAAGSAAANRSWAAELSKLRVRQAGTDLLFEFDVTGDPAETVTVDLEVTVDGRSYRTADLHLQGDVGPGAPGPRRIAWNVLREFPGGYTGDVEYSIDVASSKPAKARTGKGGAPETPAKKRAPVPLPSF